jgi:tRNA pseudouridine55 synthase
LDPNVTGVLPICVGHATKVVQYLTDAGKSYEGEVTIGFSTTTEDADGEIVEHKPVESPINREEITHVLEQLTGEITQIPPMFSAVKVNGKRLYEYARQGLTVERPERKVSIYQLELLNAEQIFTGENIRFSIRVKCSKGTYIRTLAVMIGERLGYPAHMSKLVRTSSGGISSKDCVSFEDIEKKIESSKIDTLFLPIELALDSLPKFEIHDKLASRVRNGSVLPIPQELTNIHGPIAVFNNGKAIAIYKHHPTKIGLMKPDRVLTTE